MRANLPSTPDDALKGAFDHLTTGVGVFDPEMRLIYANRLFGELRGLPTSLCHPGAELSVILHYTGIIGADGSDGEVARGLAELPGTCAWETEQVTGGGRRLLVRFAPVSGGGLMLTYSDVTEARRIEQALRENEQRYARVAEAVAEGIYDWNIERDELYVSSRLIEIFGFDGVWLTASDWNARVHPDDRVAYASALRACFQQRTRVLSCEYRIRLGNGEYRWVEDHGLPVRNERQRAIRLVGAVSDVTERKLMEQALRESEQRHALAMEAINEGVYEWDLGSRKMYYSPRVRTVLGLSAQELKTSEDWIERIHPDDLPPYRAAMVSHLKGESERLECEYRYRHPDGTWHWARQHGLAMRDESGRAIRMTGSTGDITEEKKLEIENKRLFDEVQARNRDLIESLEQQTATSEILRIISTSPTDLEPVLRAIAQNAARLCAADDAHIWRRYGPEAHLVTSWGPYPVARRRLTIGRHSVVGRAIHDQAPVHVDDLAASYATEFPDSTGMRDLGYRTILVSPLLVKGEAVGAIMIRRKEVRPFSDTQIERVGAFADQAVIAIENTRLFEEVQARTQELTESLEQQIATSEILSVIGNSMTDTQPVFEAIVHSGSKLFPNSAISIAITDGEFVRAVAVAEADAARAEAWRRRSPFPLTHEYMHSAAILDRRVIDVPDVRDAPAAFAAGGRNFLESGYRAVTIVPMMRGDAAIGALSVVRLAPGPLSDKQLATLQTFADQAVIAIENVRLFDEVKARTEDLTESLRQQTATADVLKVISRSTFDLQTVLRTLLESAVDLCEADQGTITRQRDGRFFRAETRGFSDEFRAAVSEVPVEPDRGSAIGRALLEGRVIHIPDVLADPEYTFAPGLELGDFRTILAVPMMKEGAAIGVITFTRHEARPFAGKQIELVSTFADQAAIAIENVRLFESVEAQTRQLAKSLEELRFAQDRLIQTEKLASLGQLTAGVAHEIKNPLNFVNNFSAVSVELFDELREALEGAGLDDKIRTEVAELTEMLQGNLEKVVQHGKRADSIVKNMLLHSRQGSAEHRPVDINAIVEESLELAYHGARAERQGFNITLERSFDPAAGEVDLFPQEITRVLLNLISNGFYATTKRDAEAEAAAYQPTLTAATRSLGDSVEIRIRDNGTGIPPEVKDRMFNPFFTTKPAGEGTGLGLSISHDIVVKQHAGTIEVETRQGEFTEFRIVLPRGAATIAKSGDRT